MGRPNPSCQPRETRIRNFREVALGLNKKIAQEEARRCPQCAVATCLPGCPLGIDIPGFIRLLREGETAGALEKIKKENPFPAICGRICPAPCETACVFHADGAPIAIRELERFAADSGNLKVEKMTPPSGGKKVAVIGSGPAGMGAAYFLAKMNIGVTIFEAGPEPGGSLRFGVPEMRLPQKILDEQFAQLKALGIDVQTNAIFGRTIMQDELFMRGFTAVLVAAGLGLPRFSDLPGSGLAGVYYDVEFLNRLQAVGKEDLRASAGMVAPQTMVIGSGAPAFDAARVAMRLGAKVQMVFEGFEEEAGVSQEVLKESREEGLEMLSMQVLEIMGEDGFVNGVQCRKLDIIEDKEGLKLAPSTEEPVTLPAGTVIIANGRQPVSVAVTAKEQVFNCPASGSVVEAIAAGKAAAKQIIEYLGRSA